MTRVLSCALIAFVVGGLGARSASPADEVKAIAVAPGIALHYVESGRGEPIVFVHGSLNDYSAWDRTRPAFAGSYRTVAYSRRHNFPNQNSVKRGYSAAADAEDLAALITKLGLARAHIVGHSYGALVGLFIAVRHPALVATLVLAEPPVVSLLPDRPTGDGSAMTAGELRKQLWDPVKAAWLVGDRERGMRLFLGFLSGRPDLWGTGLSETARQDNRRNFPEWDAIFKSGELFPALTSTMVRRIAAPTLIISGAHTTPFLRIGDEELTRLMKPRGAVHVVIPDAAHIMFIQQPDATNRTILDFLGKHPLNMPVAVGGSL